MTFRVLYDHVQTLTPRISRNILKDKVLSVSGINRIATVRTALDTNVCRGLFLAGTNTSRKIVEQHGCTVIVLARDLNRCWERFVYVKELMHIFDGVAEASDSGRDFEAQLAGLTGSVLTPHAKSELRCFWMALACLCPEAQRLQFAIDRAAERISDFEIAVKLRIPENYVPRLFEGRYCPLVDAALAN